MNNSTQKNCTIDNMNAFERGVKRAFDMIGALLGLIILSPVFLIIYVMQKIEGEGPAIFSQDRIGKGGKPFKIYKFRTMIVESEVDGPCLAQKDDDRLTSVGRFLRAYHLDELPQLWNVFIGTRLTCYIHSTKLFLFRLILLAHTSHLLCCNAFLQQFSYNLLLTRTFFLLFQNKADNLLVSHQRLRVGLCRK